MPTPSVRVQVMHNIAAAKYENAFFPQDGQAVANFVVEQGWLSFINAELNHWDVGLWIDMAQDRPSTVVEAPPIVAAHRHRCKQFLDSCSKVEITRRGILHLIQLARKPAKVVERPGSGAHGDRR